MTKKKPGLSIRKKLMLSYFAIVSLILIVGGIGIFYIHEVYNNGNEIYVNNLKSVEFLKSINQNVKEIDQCIVSMMSELNAESNNSYVTRISILQEETEMLMDEYENLNVTNLEERRYNQCRLSILTFNKQINSIIDSILSHETSIAVNEYEQELAPVKACTYELVEAVVELSNKNAQSKNDENKQIYHKILWLIGVVMFFSILLAIVITFSMSSYFTKKLTAIQNLAKRISEYNVADDIQEKISNDEFGITMTALNDSQFMMRDLLEKIIDESANISEIGRDVTIAVRKSNQRLESTNLQIYDACTKTEELEQLIHTLLENRSLSDELADTLTNTLKLSSQEREALKDSQSELASIIMYLEQIGITSQHQNEIAGQHWEQVKKFKI